MAGIEPGHKYQAPRRLVAAAGFHAGANLAATRDHAHLIAAAQPALARVFGVHKHQGVGRRAMQLRHPARHRARVPVLQNAAGGQPQVVLGVRFLGGGLIRQGEDHRAPVGFAVKIPTAAFSGIGVGALFEAPPGLLAVEHRPAQSAPAMVGVKVGQIVGLAAAEARVFLEQPFLQVKAQLGGFLVAVAVLDIGQRKTIDLAVGEQHLVQGLVPVLGVGLEDILGPDLIGLEAF